MTAVKKYQRNKEVNGIRYQIICELINMPTDTPADVRVRTSRIRTVAETYGLSAKTIKRWLKAYKAKGFTGLTPAYRESRSDKRLPLCFEEALERAVAMRHADNTLSVANIIRCLESENPELKNRIKRSTLQKHLQEREAARRDLVSNANQHGRKVLGRFQAKTKLALVTGDIKEPARKIVWNDEHTELLDRIYIAILIDNCHRKVLDYQISTTGNTDLFLSGLYNVIKLYGQIKALHLDLGSQYRNQKVTNACRLLNITLKYCKPRSAWQKGSIERLNRTIDDYLMEVEKVKSMGFTAFCEGFAERIKVYNDTPHSNEILNGKTPNQSFNGDLTPLVYLDDLAVANAFEFAKLCRVYSDYIKYDKRKWKIEPQYIKADKKVMIIIRPNSTCPELYTETDGCIPLKEYEIGERVSSKCFHASSPSEAYKQEYPFIDLMFREKLKREHRYTTEEAFREYMNKEVYNTISEKKGNKQELSDFIEQKTDGASAEDIRQALASITSPYTTLAEMNSKQDED